MNSALQSGGMNPAVRCSHLQHQPRRVLEAVLDADEEGDGFLAVDQAVVVAEGEIHHRADDDLAVEGDRALLDGVHAEDAALGRIEDRGAEQRAVGAAVGDGEHAAL